MKRLFIFGIILLYWPNVQAQSIISSSEALLTRIIPKQASRFNIQQIPGKKNKDVFEIETAMNIVMRK